MPSGSDDGFSAVYSYKKTPRILRLLIAIQRRSLLILTPSGLANHFANRISLVFTEHPAIKSTKCLVTLLLWLLHISASYSLLSILEIETAAGPRSRPPEPELMTPSGANSKLLLIIPPDGNSIKI